MNPIFIIGLLIFRCVSSARADQIITPVAQATQAGNNDFFGPFRGPGTIDSVYQAKNFSGPVMINGLAYRMDEGNLGLSLQAIIPRVTIQMSTYSGTYSSYLVGPGYNGNKGPDDTKVFDAGVSWSSTDLPGSAPNPFDLKIQFSKPFLYNPANGALLVGFTTSGNFFSSITADSESHGDSSIGWFGDKTRGNLVTQFDVTSIPEPQFGWLFALGAFALISARRKHPGHS
jgi:hypothetical protein